MDRGSNSGVEVEEVSEYVAMMEKEELEQEHMKEVLETRLKEELKERLLQESREVVERS